MNPGTTVNSHALATKFAYSPESIRKFQLLSEVASDPGIVHSKYMKFLCQVLLYSDRGSSEVGDPQAPHS